MSWERPYQDPPQPGKMTQDEAYFICDEICGGGGAGGCFQVVVGASLSFVGPQIKAGMGNGLCILGGSEFRCSFQRRSHCLGRLVVCSCWGDVTCCSHCPWLEGSQGPQRGSQVSTPRVCIAWAVGVRFAHSYLVPHHTPEAGWEPGQAGCVFEMRASCRCHFLDHPEPAQKGTALACLPGPRQRPAPTSTPRYC